MYAAARASVMSLACVALTELYTGRAAEKFAPRKAFVHAVMDGMKVLSEGGRGPTTRGFAIGLMIIVTL